MDFLGFVMVEGEGGDDCDGDDVDDDDGDDDDDDGDYGGDGVLMCWCVGVLV